MPVPTLARCPGAIVAASAARRSQPASCSFARAGSALLGERLNETINSVVVLLLERPQALGHRGRHPRPHAHAVGRVLALEVAGEVVQLGEHRAALVRHEQLHGLEARAEGLFDATLQLLEALTGEGRHQHRVAARSPTASST